MLGIAVQLTSGLAYALKFTAVKFLFKSPELGAGTLRPSKLQIAFVASPATAAASLACIPLFPQSKLELPVFWDVAVCGVSVLVIIMSELELTEITSPLAVAVLAAAHNIVIIVFFTLKEGEEITMELATSVAFSTLGSLAFALAKHQPPNAKLVGFGLNTNEYGESKWRQSAGRFFGFVVVMFLVYLFGMLIQENVLALKMSCEESFNVCTRQKDLLCRHYNFDEKNQETCMEAITAAAAECKESKHLEPRPDVLDGEPQISCHGCTGEFQWKRKCKKCNHDLSILKVKAAHANLVCR
eukprot:gnl/MRDRNA2_/MRDRNA2_228352_c0_seq1.p1 gnl/MRDRNA2_/MRDRNA2_228352_c0~~gnl/MRDRNA2_/MRDRNA2_228352_c0_seq1.p1  ORF type:complete len:318 (+),score=65.76 gnl/MRDRNA2_/MRDRNA2_228352_c0_seq1:58-954(+)